MSSSDSPPTQVNLSDSSVTIPSDSENYSGSANNELSPSPPSSSSSPMILYKPPTIWGLLRGAAINLILPFVNGMMLGFGELLAHEAAFRFGWSGTKVRRYTCIDSSTAGCAKQLVAVPRTSTNCAKCYIDFPCFSFLASLIKHSLITAFTIDISEPSITCSWSGDRSQRQAEAGTRRRPDRSCFARIINRTSWK